MRNATPGGGSFNAIHFDSVFKVDFFVAGEDEFSLGQLNRRESRKLSPQSTETVYVATVEDTILAKLRWYRAGQETSDTQWKDVVGMLGTSSSNLDRQYLHAWADKLDLTELLKRALLEVQDDQET
jgi:hypothetical protein